MEAGRKATGMAGFLGEPQKAWIHQRLSIKCNLAPEGIEIDQSAKNKRKLSKLVEREGIAI